MKKTVDGNRLVKMRMLACIYIVAMCTQIVPVEGYGVSWVKIVLMFLSPILIILIRPRSAQALVLGMAFWLIMLVCAMMSVAMRFSTLGLAGMYILTYSLVYGLIYKNVFTLSFFVDFVKGIIFAYFICIVLQQFCLVIGLCLPFFNLMPMDTLGKLRSLATEPSHAARILGCAYYCYLFCSGGQAGKNLTINEIFNKNHRKVTLAFLWTMFTMGSTTAFVMIAIISLYFVRNRTLFYVVPIFFILVTVLVSLNLEQIQRFWVFFEAVQTNDVSTIIDAESSGAARFLPLYNTIQGFDLTSKSFLFGNGTIMDEYDIELWKEYLMTQKISTIEQYGFVTWIVSLLFVFKCAIRKIFCVETLIFIVALGFNISNIAYVWGIMMLFTVIKYFEYQHKKYLKQKKNDKSVSVYGDLQRSQIHKGTD